MAPTISDRLWTRLDEEGFVSEEGVLRLYDSSDRNYSEIADEFFEELIRDGEILHFTYSEEEIYTDITNSYGCIAFSWFDGVKIDMIIYETES